MSMNDRAQCSVSVTSPSARIADVTSSECAVGTFAPRVIGLRKPVTLDQGQRAGLLDLVAAGRMIDTTRARVTTDIGRFLKRYSFAVAGFHNDMVPTERGKLIAKELGAGNAVSD